MMKKNNILKCMLILGVLFPFSSLTSSKVEAQANSQKNDYGAYNKSADSLYDLACSYRATLNYKKSIETSLVYINYIEKNQNNLDSSYLIKKFEMYMQAVMGYSGLGQWDKAKLYQNKLFEVFQQKKIPEGWNSNHYCFDHFEWNGLRIFGYEYFPEFGYPVAEGNTSKYVYHIQNKNKIIFSLETLKNNNARESDFMLKRDDNEENDAANLYTNPIDYQKLHDAVVTYLKANVPVKQN
jgi:hypothetical protein